MSSIPTFIDISEAEQCEELRDFFAALNAPLEPKSASLERELQQLVSVSGSAFKDDLKDSDAECVLNSLVSILMVSPEAHKLVPLFAQQMLAAKTPRAAAVASRVLRNLFAGLQDFPELRMPVYLALVRLSSVTGHVQHVFEDVHKLKQWFPVARVGAESLRALLRELHAALLDARMTSEASHVLVELLSTFGEETASEARDDAHKCIVACLMDKDTFLMDHLLALKPVKFLEGEPIHDLLTIFVADKLSAYLKFHSARKEFVESLGLSHEQNLQKMRLLTFMQMAESRKDIPFDAIQHDLQLSSDQVEAFVIDVLRTRLVKAKVDQVNRRVVVSSTMHRTFGRAQWQTLRDTLSTWALNLAGVQRTVAAALHATN